MKKLSGCGEAACMPPHFNNIPKKLLAWRTSLKLGHPVTAGAAFASPIHARGLYARHFVFCLTMQSTIPLQNTRH